MSNAPYGRHAWTPEEDAKLREIMESANPIIWTEIAAKFPNRTGKQCRERWINHLNPEIKESEWTTEEDEKLFQCHQKIGNKWATIAKFMPGRSENSIKNRWYSSIVKRIIIDPYGNTILRSPISRGRSKRASLKPETLLQRGPFMSVPLLYAPMAINFPVQTVVIPNQVIDDHASVPIKQAKLQKPISLMTPNFAPRQEIPQLPKETPHVKIQTPPKTDVLSVTSLMNPNFPPKSTQPTVIVHANKQQQGQK